MQTRTRSHFLVVALLGITVIAGAWKPQIPRLIDPVSAVVETRSPSPSPLLSDIFSEDITPRSGLSTRDIKSVVPPSPAPHPAPVAPTETPIAVAAVKPPTIKGSGVLAWPLSIKGHITTYYRSGHRAIDLGAACGTPVFASFSGKITYAGWMSNGGGNVVMISADNGMLLSYDHLSAFSALDTLVIAGQQIGAVGATGDATGCHLHFGVKLNGTWVNPLLYL